MKMYYFYKNNSCFLLKQNKMRNKSSTLLPSLQDTVEAFVFKIKTQTIFLNLSPFTPALTAPICKRCSLKIPVSALFPTLFLPSWVGLPSVFYQDKCSTSHKAQPLVCLFHWLLQSSPTNPSIFKSNSQKYPARDVPTEFLLPLDLVLRGTI